MNSNPRIFYSDLLSAAKEELDKLLKRINLITWLRTIVVLLTIAGVWWLILNTEGVWWIAAISGAAVFLILLNIHTALKREETICRTKIQVLEEELRSLDGDFNHHQHGRKFIKPIHPFSFDLDLFGIGSIYQLICRTVTLKGAAELAKRLQFPYANDKVDCISRQTLVKELKEYPDFLVRYRTLGRVAPEAAGDFDNVIDWLEQPAQLKKTAKWLRWICPIITIITLTLSFQQGGWHPALGLAIAMNWTVLLIYRKQTVAGFRFLSKLTGFIGKYEGIFSATASMEFNHPELRKQVELSKNVVRGLPALKKLINRIENRQNPFVGPLMNAFFIYDIQNLLDLQSWKRKEGVHLKEALLASATLDAQISFAVYSFNNPGYVFPEFFDDQRIMISGKNVRHPLLREQTAVGNDFTIGIDEQLYLLTGANMTGKSTFIRTLGVHLIMGHLGLPVPAESLRMSLCRLYTSMRITDSVQEDISYFKAELNRIKDLLETISEERHPYLVLLDEPLRGTNSADKQSGTAAIIRKLTEKKVIGVVATHDTGLGRLEQELDGKIRNYHFESQLAAGQLQFDFKLKPGCSTTNNATQLMQQMGII